MNYGDSSKDVRVCGTDGFTGEDIYGFVIDRDNLMRKMFIEWDDIIEPCWHGEDELKNFKLV